MTLAALVHSLAVQLTGVSCVQDTTLLHLNSNVGRVHAFPTARQLHLQHACVLTHPVTRSRQLHPRPRQLQSARQATGAVKSEQERSSVARLLFILSSFHLYVLQPTLSIIVIPLTIQYVQTWEQFLFFLHGISHDIWEDSKLCVNRSIVPTITVHRNCPPPNVTM